MQQEAPGLEMTERSLDLLVEWTCRKEIKSAYVPPQSPTVRDATIKQVAVEEKHMTGDKPIAIQTRALK